MSVQSWIPDQDEDNPDSIFGLFGLITRLSAIFKFYDTKGNKFAIFSREINKVVISRIFFSLAEISHKIDLLSGNGLLGQPTTLCSVFQFIGNEEDG